MTKGTDNRVLNFPQPSVTEPERTPLHLLALELGDLRMQIERLRFDQQQALRRDEARDRKIAAQGKTISRLKKAISANPGPAPRSRASKPADRPSKSPPHPEDFGAALDDLNG